jgi:hypothetical protein
MADITELGADRERQTYGRRRHDIAVEWWSRSSSRVLGGGRVKLAPAFREAAGKIMVNDERLYPVSHQKVGSRKRWLRARSSRARATAVAGWGKGEVRDWALSENGNFTKRLRCNWTAGAALSCHCAGAMASRKFRGCSFQLDANPRREKSAPESPAQAELHHHVSPAAG